MKTKNISVFLFILLGQILVISAQTPVPDQLFESNQAEACFYRMSVSDAGDINADGFDDIIIGVPYYDNGETNEGRVYIYSGSPEGIDLDAPAILETNVPGGAFGWDVASAGDVNADGFDDIIIGAYYFNNGEIGEGRAYIYYGSSSGVNPDPTTLEINQFYAYFGYSVSGAGDVNADGFDDVIIGALEYHNGQGKEGGAFLYLGTSTGISTTAATIHEGNQSQAYFGNDVACAGDVNADGFDDIIIGAFNYDNGEVDEGRTYIYTGNA